MKCGQVATADDMTANVYIWVEWPNEQGFLLLRPQLLVTMDVRSMAWLNYRVVIRPKGQYNRDDVWGLIGDLFDSFGLFETMILEGGSWQSDLVRGQRTGLSDEERMGGLKSLGVKVVHTRTPRGKIIEGPFHQLQLAMDNCRGFCGRMEMKDCPESVKRQIAEVRSGKAHPRQYFMHLQEFSAHVASVMQNLNNERNDGKLLRGASSWEMWATEKPALPVPPDSHKWMYRDSYSISLVTRNGVRITQGSGRNQVSYSYDNPAVMEVWRGRRVVAYWNAANPDTDACVFTIKAGRPDKFLCVAKRVREIPRLGASEEASAAEATRKKLHSQLAVSKSVTLAPFLQRNHRTLNSELPTSNKVGERIAEARAAGEEKERDRQTVQKTERRLLAEAGELSELLGERAAVAVEEEESISMEELHEL